MNATSINSVATLERPAATFRVGVGFWERKYYDVTVAQYQAYIEAADRHREHLIAAERKRGPIITEQAAENIASGMAAWREWYHAKHFKAVQ